MGQSAFLFAEKQQILCIRGKAFMGALKSILLIQAVLLNKIQVA